MLTKNRLAITLLSTIVFSFFVVASLLYAELTSNIKVSVNNAGLDSLKSVVLLTEDGRHALGDIKPGNAVSTSIRPLLDSNLTILVGGKKELVVDTFVRRGYKGKITINLTNQKIVSFQDELYIGWK